MKVLTFLAAILFIAAIGEALTPPTEARQSFPRTTEKTEDITSDDVVTMVQCSAYLSMLAQWADLQGQPDQKNQFIGMAAQYLQVSLFFSPTVTDDESSFLGSAAISSKVRAENLFGSDGAQGTIDAFGRECGELDKLVIEHAAFIEGERQ